jgi:deazaflavin-dependent oxidoreductase (nitroreductase family)
MRLGNPLMARLASRSGGKMGDQILVLHFTGRKTGKSYRTPVGYHRIDGRVAMVTSSKWRHNFRGGADVKVTIKGQTIPARAELMSDPPAVASLYEQFIDEIGWEKAGRQLGIKINVDRRPTRQELEEMIARSGTSIVWVDLEAPKPN